jgi:hypothetical protein
LACVVFKLLTGVSRAFLESCSRFSSQSTGEGLWKHMRLYFLVQVGAGREQVEILLFD